MENETVRLHVDNPGDYVLVPQEDFDSLIRTLTLLASEDFKGQFEKSKQSEGKTLAELKEKYTLSA